jgi:hypothetical protein
MGERAPIAIETAGLAMLFVFVGISARAAWCARSSWAAIVAIGLPPAAAVFLWVAYFSRADEYHWPVFFAAMSLLPFVLSRNPHFSASRSSAIALLAVACGGMAVSFTVVPAQAIPQVAFDRIRENLDHLFHLRELRDQREGEWRALADSEALPRVRQRVGAARIDMLTWQQETILLNGLNYAPRPVFQSHAAYTPKLARLNESYFLGPDAPEFVLFRLDVSDNRVPMSEDGLALIGLLRRYRPVLMENSFLLLQRDASAAMADAIAVDNAKARAELGALIPVSAKEAPSIAFIDVELNVFGRLYTLFFPEPALGITIDTDAGESVHYKLIRLTASSGFMINPLVRSTPDWLNLYFSKALARVRGLRIDSESPWERMLFERNFTLAWRPINILHADSSTASAELRAQLYPGFNLDPAKLTAPLRIVTEDGQDSLFLHAPATLSFQPPPGRYRISATFGIQESAITDQACVKAGPDGVGISLILHHAGEQTMLWHGNVDPFHTAQDRGAHHMSIFAVDIGAGESVDYRVDTGEAGTNSSCDWSYLRDLKFVPSTDPAYDRIHLNGFD